jgi:hypothetical protein
MRREQCELAVGSKPQYHPRLGPGHQGAHHVAGHAAAVPPRRGLRRHLWPVPTWCQFLCSKPIAVDRSL